MVGVYVRAAGLRARMGQSVRSRPTLRVGVVVRVELFRQEKEITQIVPGWTRLAKRGSAGVFSSPAWALSAWKWLPQLGAPLLVSVFDRETLVGILALTIEERRTGTIVRCAGTPLGDRYDALVRPESKREAMVGILTGLRNCLADGGTAALSELDPRGYLALSLTSHRFAAARRGLRIERRTSEPSPWVHLPTHDRVDTLWSASRLKSWRNRWRWLANRGRVAVTRVNGPAEIATEVPEFVRRRLGFWAERGKLELLPDVERAPQFPSFLAEACSALASHGGCFLTHLTVNDNPIASDLYFRVPGVDILYMRSFDPAWAAGSPGHLLFAETARTSSLENVRAVELGRGDEPYKRQIGGVMGKLLDVVVTAD